MYVEAKASLGVDVVGGQLMLNTNGLGFVAGGPLSSLPSDLATAVTTFVARNNLNFAWVWVPLAVSPVDPPRATRLTLGAVQTTALGVQSVNAAYYWGVDSSFGVDCWLESVAVMLTCATPPCKLTVTTRLVGLPTTKWFAPPVGSVYTWTKSFGVPMAASRLFTFDLTADRLRVSAQARVVVNCDTCAFDAAAGSTARHTSSASCPSTAPCSTVPLQVNLRVTGQPIDPLGSMYASGAPWLPTMNAGSNVADSGIGVFTGQPHQTAIDLNAQADTGGAPLPALYNSGTGITYVDARRHPRQARC